MSTIDSLGKVGSLGLAGGAAASNATLAALAASNKEGGAQSGQGTSAAEQQSRFLTLLVAQMKNQDPLNPVDNSEVTSQLAQISTVDGIERLNSTMKMMSSSLDGSQAVQGAALAGRQVLATGDSLELTQGKGSGGFELNQAVEHLNIVISNAAGGTVHHVSLGPQQPGVHAFEWDGMTDAAQSAVDGTYSYKIQALAGGKEVPVTPLSFGRVDGVSRGADGFALNVGRLGMRSLDQVKQIMQ
ncbi:MAG: flagellar hook assembly protein FlgD [Burkholderiales bacterium]